MSGIELTAGDLLSLISHAKKWVSNLRRAKLARKRESKGALRDVILAVRKTTLYTRSLKEGGAKSLEQERELSLLWTELSFKLEDLGLTKLAKRCSIGGKYWADPASMDSEFLEKAGVGLEDIERLARLSLQELR